MKKILLMVFCTFTFCSGCVTHKIVGEFTMISTRNVDSNMDNYFLLKPYSAGTDKEINKSRFETMKDAIDNTVKLVGGGELLKNAKVYLVIKNRTHTYFAVEGDVWGYKDTPLQDIIYNGLKKGDRVQWGIMKNIGTVVSIDLNDGSRFIIKNEKNGKFVKVKRNKLITISQTTSQVEKNEPVVNKKETQVESKSDFKVGDYVMFKDGASGNFVKGKINSVYQGVAFVEFQDPNNPEKTKEVGKEFSLLNKIDQTIDENKTIPKTNDIKVIAVGDYVSFRKFDNSPLLKGKVIKINQNIVAIEYPDPSDKSKTREIELDIKNVTKSEK